jgi:DNA-binding transcriptional LysR family regulator
MNNKISLEALEILDAIARKGSFASAAESLFRVPSAITYSVRKLEEDLGVPLFNRSGHRATLTEAGEELLHEGRHLLQAAQELEARVKRVATGVETELSIALSDVLPIEPLFSLIDEFYTLGFGTRIKVLQEVYGGTWDALVSGRAEISIGVPGDAPASGGFSVRPMGILPFVFAVAPSHPLAAINMPLENQDIIQYRSVSAADSSRNLPPRTSGILTGQDVLTVANMNSKVKAQINGLGVGYLPKYLADEQVALGKLIIKEVAESKPEVLMYYAWRSQNKTMGKAKQWLIKRLEKTAFI